MVTANYNAYNQVTFAVGVAPNGFTYDPAGNVLFDGVNTYLYDAEGRICAVSNTPTPGVTTMTGYIYGADGARVAKGSLATWPSACPAPAAITLKNSYVLGLGGEQTSEVSVSGTGPSYTSTWAHTNIFANGQLLATYNPSGSQTYFALHDWLGSKRMEYGATGCVESYFSLPYGNAQAPSGNCSDATEHHFTGKERDAESGNDYFGARYYASSMGRFMSPDWATYPAPVPYASYGNPQSLYLYNYMRNNPFSGRDPDGHHQECGEETMSTDKNGNSVVNANCHDVPDWWQFKGVRRWLGHHPKTVKTVGNITIGVTVLSGLVDGGASELAVPEEIALEEALFEAGETAVEETAEAAEGAEAAESGTAGEATADSAQMKKLSNGEIKQLKEKGIDPHDLKPNSKYDLFKNKDGEIFVKPKAGNGPGEPTGINIKD